MLNEVKSASGRKRIFCDVSKCVGCKNCEISCAVEHSKNKALSLSITEDITPIKRRRVQVELHESYISSPYEAKSRTESPDISIDLSKNQKLSGAWTKDIIISDACHHCENAPCVTACMSGAMYKEKDGSTQHDKEKCVGCWMCIMVCPFGTIRRQKKLALKCDLCKDRQEGPACVPSCKTKALTIKEE